MTLTTTSIEATAASGEGEVVAAIKTALVRVFEKMADDIAAVYLFGSSVCAQIGPLSDIDLAILLQDEKFSAAADIRIDFYLDCCRALKRNDIDVIVLNSTRNLFLLNDVVRHGAVLYDTDPSLRHEFEVKAVHDFIEFRDHRKKVMGV